MIEATSLSNDHLLDLGPASMQRAQGYRLRRRRSIEPNVLCLGTILSKLAKTDPIDDAVAAKVPYTRAVRPVDGNTHLKGHIEDVALVAASGFTDDEHLSELFLVIARNLGPDQTAHRQRFVVDCALLVGRQSVDHERFFGNFERNDVTERASRRSGRHGARPLS
jgi:hypothetical protein